ncbi:MAG: hypothetical protein AB7N24_01645 [Dehalococcoidia bacterium]
MITNRTAAISGILFALLYGAGVFMTAGQNIFLDHSDAEVLSEWEDANKWVTIAGAYIFTISALAFALFVLHLRARCAGQGRASEFANAGVLLGVIAIVVMAIGFQGDVALWVGSTFNGEFDPTADTIRAMASLAFSMVVIVGAPTMALAVGLLSWEMRTTLAPWVGWLGLVCALALLVAFFRFPLMALPIWTIATSIALLRSKEISPA